MRLHAEIQKRQQSVSNLKRQVEQLTASAGDDKKAGIRVADALRKRKLRALLKDVKILDPAVRYLPGHYRFRFFRGLARETAGPVICPAVSDFRVSSRARASRTASCSLRSSSSLGNTLVQ